MHDLNALIDSNREIVERARTHVGNLAHALKTPLAVLQNETAQSREPLAAKVAEQIGIMRDQVEHHLNRARIAAQANVLGAVTPIEPVIAALARVMGKVHQERQLAIAVEAPAGLRFRGEKHDLEEMAGNLFDNACKWAKSRVRISARREDGERRPFLLVCVRRRRARAAAGGPRRGARARRPARRVEAGLGARPVDRGGARADLWRRAQRWRASDLGGLSARLRLPAAGE